jgi:hypothetical protein
MAPNGLSSEDNNVFEAMMRRDFGDEDAIIGFGLRLKNFLVRHLDTIAVKIHLELILHVLRSDPSCVKLHEMCRNDEAIRQRILVYDRIFTEQRCDELLSTAAAILADIISREPLALARAWQQTIEFVRQSEQSQMPQFEALSKLLYNRLDTMGSFAVRGPARYAYIDAGMQPGDDESAIFRIAACALYGTETREQEAAQKLVNGLFASGRATTLSAQLKRLLLENSMTKLIEQGKLSDQEVAFFYEEFVKGFLIRAYTPEDSKGCHALYRYMMRYPHPSESQCIFHKGKEQFQAFKETFKRFLDHK